MKVAFDASAIFGYAGINTYTRMLVHHLAKEFPSDRFVLLSSYSRSREKKLRTLFGQHGNIEIRRALPNPQSLGPPFSRITFMARSLTMALHARSVDLLHVTQPYRERIRAGNTVITAHDFFPLTLDDYRREGVEREFRRNAAFVLGGARAIIVYTEYIKAQLLELFPGIRAADVHIVGAAADEAFRPIKGDPLPDLDLEHPPGTGYFFYVGSAYPRKNLPRVMQAYMELPEEIRREHHLIMVVTGAELHRDDLLREYRGLLDNRGVHLLRAVSEELLVKLYGSATALVFPSLDEGFGLPVLEAMRCGCPVITSNLSGLPEVAGDAALLVNPRSVKAISTAMLELLLDPGRREEMRKKGFYHSHSFSWGRTARQTMEVYRSVTGECSV